MKKMILYESSLVPVKIFWPPSINSLTWAFIKNGLDVFQQVYEVTQKVKHSVAL